MPRPGLKRRRQIRTRYPQFVEPLEERVLLTGEGFEDLDAGPEVRLNTHTENWQGSIINGNQATARFPDGGFVSVWTSAQQDASSYGVYGQKFDAEGLPVGPEFRVNQTTRNSQRGASVDVAPDGRFAVVWQSRDQDTSIFGVYARVYAADGTALSDEFLINQQVRGHQKNADVTFLAEGNLAFTWEGQSTEDYFGVYARVFDAAGQPLSDQVLANTVTNGKQRNPVIQADSSGGFWTVWNGRGVDNYTSIYARRFSADGEAVSDVFRVNQYRKDVQQWPTIAASDDGRMLIAWTSQHDYETSWGVFGRLYSPNGRPAGPEFRANRYIQGAQKRPSGGFLPDGGFVLAWSGRGYGDRTGVFARRFTREGIPTAREAMVNVTTPDLQARPSVATGRNGYTVSWGGNGPGDNHGRFARNVRTNLPPELDSIEPQQVRAGIEVAFTATATDPNLPDDVLTFSLSSDAPGDAVIDPGTGAFRWTPTDDDANSTAEFDVIVTDAAGASDSQSVSVDVLACPVHPERWTVTEHGGSENEAGTVEFQSCNATLQEGDSFLVSMATSFVVAEGATTLEFEYAQPAFDKSDHDFINDAFEVSLTDPDGNPLVVPYTERRDAFFNITETQGIAASDSASASSRRVTVDISDVLPGETATLTFRLANNDSDTGSSISVVDVALPEHFGPQRAPVSGQSRTDSRAITLPESRGIGLASQSSTEVSAGTRMRPLTGNSRATFAPEVEWSRDEFSIRPESTQSMSTPVVMDMNRDGTPDIVFPTFSSDNGSQSFNTVLRALDGATGAELWTGQHPDLEVSGYGGVALGDIDNDGLPEAVVAGFGNLIAFEHDGTTKWSSEFNTRGVVYSDPTIADVDQDGTPEVLLGPTVYNNDGTIRWEGQAHRNGISLVADVDADGQSEVVVGGTIYSHDGEIETLVNLLDGFTAIANLDEDTTPEIVVVGGGAILAYQHDGTVDWGPISIPNAGRNGGGSPTIADMDGDGLPEIGVAGASNYVVFEHDGTVKWTSPTQDQSSRQTGSTVHDFEGDGRAEVIYNDELTLRVYDGQTGTVLYSLPNTSGTSFEYPIVVDVDGDGSAEIVTAANLFGGQGQSGVYVIGDPTGVWVGTRTLWNQHAYSITNVNDDGSIPRIPASSWEVYNNFRRNRQPTGTQLGEPLITVSAPGTRFPAGEHLVLSGLASAQGTRSDGQPNAIDIVTVNARPVDVLDVSGQFFATVEVLPGRNEFSFVATDSVGQQTAVTVTVVGRTDSGLDLTRFTDITGSFSGVYGRTSFTAESTQLGVNLATRNDGTFESDVPLLVGVRNISDPDVSVVDPDGFLPDGTPYVDYTAGVPGGRLTPGEVTAAPAIRFANPNLGQFDYELVFLGDLNDAPIVETVPVVEAAFGREYRYDVDARDSDGDEVTYQLTTAPAGMQIDPASGEITWTPTESDRGLHDVAVTADDGRGGVATQTFTVAANEAPPNRPPVIVSTPVTTATVAETDAIFGEITVADPTLANAVVEIVATLPRPTGLTFAPAESGFPDDLFVASHRGQGWPGAADGIDRIYQIGSAGGAVEFANLGFEADPVSLAFSEPGSAYGDFLYVSNNNQDGGRAGDHGGTIQRISETGEVSNFTSVGLPSGPGEPGGIAFGSGVFTDSLYVANRNDAPGDILKIDESGQLSNFVDDGQFFPAGLEPSDIAFSTGGPFGENLYFTDADFWGDGSNAIRRVSPDGAITTLAELDVFPRAAQFGPGGPFGTDLYVSVADESGSSVLRISPAGQVTEVASGFGFGAAGGSNGGYWGLEDVQFSSDGTSLYLADHFNDRVLRIVADASPVYTYDVAALDPDNDALTYTVRGAPEGLWIDGTTGVIHWAPSASQVGNHKVTVEVSDGNGGVAHQEFVVCVHPDPANHAPTIVSAPITSLDTGVSSEPVPVDLAQAEVVQYDASGFGTSHSNPNADWQISADGKSVEQVINANPSIFLTDIDVSNSRVGGSWRVDTAFDDDWMGFVFGYQDRGNFYLFRWIQANNGGLTYQEEPGMQVVVMESPPGATDAEIFQNGRIIYQNDVPWDDFTDYEFSLDFRAGQFEITVTDANSGDRVTPPISLIDDTFTSGQFGFYNHSLSNVIYRGFASTPLPATPYRYDVDAIDPDNDVLSYSLVTGPAGMTVDPDTGLVEWMPTDRSLRFDGVNDLVEVQHFAGLPTETFTLSAWIRTTSIDGERVIVSRGEDNFSDNNPWKFHVLDGVLALSSEEQSDAGTIYNSGAFVSDGSWHHVAASRSSSGTLTFFVDGEVVETFDNTRVPSSNNTQSMTIGSHQGSSGPALNPQPRKSYFDGHIDDVLIFDRAVTPEDIHELAERRLVTTGLVAGWSFSEGFGSQSSDLVSQRAAIFGTAANTSPHWSSDTPPRTAQVTLLVEDGRGGADEQTFEIHVGSHGTGRIHGRVIDGPERAASGTFEIDFDEVQPGDIVNNQYATLGVSFGLAGRPEKPVIVEVPDIYPPAGGMVLSPNVSTSSTDFGDIDIRFDPPVDYFTIYALDADEPVTVRAYFEGTVVETSSRSPGSNLQVYNIKLGAMNADQLIDRVVVDLVDGTNNSSHRLGPEYFDRVRFHRPVPAADVVAESTFDTDLDGWTFSSGITHVATGGAPGGFARFIDGGPATGGQLFAPDKFHGDWRPYEHTGFLQYDYRVISAGQLPFASGNVTLTGPGGSAYSSPVVDGTRTTDWVSFFTPLEERHWTVTQGNWNTLLEDITSVLVSMPAASTASEATGLDNFRLIQPPEPPVEWTVYLDQNENGVRDHGERFVVTHPNGAYAFSGLPADTYHVREELRPGWVQTFPGTPTHGHAVVLPAGEVATEIDFVNEQLGASTNQAPDFTTLPSESATASDLFRYNAAANDPENDPITFSLPLAPDGMTVHPTLGAVVWIPGFDQVGTHNVLLQVADDRGGVNVQPFSLTVGEPNVGPVITSMPATRAVDGRLYSYVLAAQDADGDPISFRIDSGPADMSLTAREVRNSAGDLVETRHTLTWNASTVGSSHEISIVASDPNGGEHTQTFTLDVVESITVNTTPTILSVPRTTARFGLEWTYPVAATDVDGDPLTFSLPTGPDGMSISETGVVSWTPPADSERQAPVEVVVEDGRGGLFRQAFALDVVSADQNSAPMITSVPTVRAMVDHAYVYDPTALDPDADEVSWSLTAGPRGMSIDSGSGALRWTPDDQQLGDHRVAVTASDGFGERTTQRFELHVGCNNLAPAIVSIPPTVALADRVYLYAVRADDFEHDPLSWRLATAPDGMTIDAETGVIRWIPGTDQIDSFEVVVEADDGLNVGTQSYTVVVSDADDPVDPDDPTQGTKGNRAPIITSTPSFAAEVDSLYVYQLTGVDPDGDDFVFDLGPDAPTGMMIDESGLITWTPTADDVGDYLITVTATDEPGATSAQGYALSARTNGPPEITSSPVETVTRNAAYRYSVRAIDPDGDPLSWQLNAAPDGMTIDSRGRIVWDTASFDEDAANVTVTVADDRGQTDSQSWTITLADDTEPPAVSISITSEGRVFDGNAELNVGAVYTVRVLATDNVGVADVGLSVGGTPVALDSGQAVTLNADELGAVTLTAFATDTSNLRGQSQATVTVTDPQDTNRKVPADPTVPPWPGEAPGDTGQPIVTITSPAIGSTISNIVPIIGTVDDPENNLWYYRVHYARADRVSITDIDLDDPDWIQINEGTEEVIEGELAVFDPAGLANDAYAVIVEGYDVNGAGYVRPTLFQLEGNVLVGNFQLELTDLSIPLAGIPIEVTRVYDSTNAVDQRDFGFGWRLGVQDARILEVTALSAGGAFNPGNDKFIPTLTKVYLTNPAGQRVGFTYHEELISYSFFGGIWRPYFEPDPGVYDRLTIDETTVARGGLIGDLSQGINPSAYTLTTKDNLRYRYADSGELQTVTDTNGNVVTYTRDGITHSSGQSIDFIRDHRDRIERIVDPAGNEIVYEYDLAGDLVGVTNQANLTTTYRYRTDHPHFLDRAFNPQGQQAFKVRYNAHGMFVGVLDADGNRVDSRNFDTDENKGVIRDAAGNPTTLYYDDRGNVLREIDPEGNTTFREYNDPANPDLETRIIDRRGFITDRSYDARGNVLTIEEIGTESDPFEEPVVTSFSYDTRNNVTSITNAASQTTRFEYDSSNNLVTITNALNDESSFTYDSEGRRASFTDFNGNITEFDYTDACPCGSPSTITYEDGTYQTFEYNQFGQVTIDATYEVDGTLVERRETLYDQSGRVTAEISGQPGDPAHPQTIVKRFYDGHLLDWEAIVHPDSQDTNGNLLESPDTPVADRKSRITDFEYDNSDRVIRQIDAEGGIVDFRYDAQGNRVALRDPVGNITTWVYDSRNRAVEERDPFYWVDLRESDAAFAGLTDDEFLDLVAPIVPASAENPVDPLYDDPSGADCETNTRAEHIRLTCYDEEGNQSKTIDRNGRRREFAYDHAGRLLEETWFTADTGTLVETISFAYDDLGNMLTATDSNSNYLFEYDVMNRLRSVDNNPDGTRDVPRVVLTYDYDAQGNVTRTRDDAGATVDSEYDTRNRLAIRNWYDADGSGDVDEARVDFQYNAAGRESVSSDTQT